MAQQAKLVITINGKEVENTLRGVGAEIGKLRSDLRKLNDEDPEFKTKAAELRKAQQRYAEINREIRGLPQIMKAASDSFEAQKRKVEQLRQELEKSSTSSSEYKKKVTEYRTEMKKLDDLNTQMTGKPSFWEKLAGQASMFTTIATGIFTFNTLASKFRQLIDLSAELSDKQADVQKTTGMTKKEVRELTQELDKLDTRTSRIDLLSIAREGGQIGIANENLLEFVEAMDRANVALGDTFGSVSETATVLGKLKFLFQETADMDVAEAYDKIGSSLAELATSGVASEQNIAAFATRVGSLPEAFKPSIADALALGAAFEESGVEANVAARSYSILVQTAATKTQEFAKVMGMTKDEVTKLINSNPTEFFLRFTKSFEGMESNGTKMAGILKDLGVNAMGVNMIIGAAANNNDRFRESIELSNEAMEEGTSLYDIFNEKNENLAASLEKIQKTFIEWIDSDRVQDFLEGLVNWFGGLIGAIDNSDKKASTFIKTLDFSVKTIAVLIASFVSWTAAMKLSALWSSINLKNMQLYTVVTKGATLSQVVNTLAVSAAGVVYNRLTGNTVAAKNAQLAFNSALRANPLGLFLTTLTAVVGAIMVYRTRIKDVAKEQREFGESVREAHKQAAEGVTKTISKISSLINAIKDENISLESRKKAYEELIKIAPEFNGFLKDEKFNIEGLTAAYKQYITQLQGVSRAKATIQLADDATAAVQKGAAEIFQVELELANARKKLDDTQTYRNDRIADGITSAYKAQRKVVQELEETLQALLKTQSVLEARQEASISFTSNEAVKVEEEIKNIEAIINSFELLDTEASKKLAGEYKSRLEWLKREKNILLRILDTDADPVKGNGEGDGPKNDDKEIERRKKTAEELLKIEIRKNRQIRDEQLKNREEEAKLMQEGWEKELELLDIDRQKRLNKLADELQDIEELRKEYQARALEEAKKGNKAGAQGYRTQADELQKIIEEKNKTYLYIEETFQFDLQKLKFENYKKELDKHQKQYDRELRNLETRHNNELKALSDLEEAKELLREEYGYSDEELNKLKDFEKAKSKIVLAQQEETYKIQSEQLKNQIEDLQNSLAFDDALSDTVFGRMFDEEQREQILEFIEELENKLSNLNAPTETDGDNEEKKVMSFIDIFGFSADQWQEAFSNLDTLSGRLQLAQMGIQAMTEAWNMYYQMQRQNMQRDLDNFTATTNRKKSELQKQLDEGYISQEFYNAKVEKLEADLEKKRAEMEYQSAMSEWKMSLLQAATNTAVGITAALSMTPPNFVIAGIVGAMGAFQAGMIAANKPAKPQGYFFGGESGGSGRYDAYGRELADGPLHAREYVIPEWLRKDPQIARMEEFIEARRRGGTPPPVESIGYASGGETRPAIPASEPSTLSIPPEFISVLVKLDQTIEELRERPLEARLTRTMEVAKSISDDLEDYRNHRTKNRR